MKSLTKKEYLSLLFFLTLTLFLSIPAILPLFHSGFFSFHDNTQVARVYEMGKVLQQGIFPVRWVPDLGYGYGYPIFNFYAPLSYYIGGFLMILGTSSLIATKIMFGIGILLSGVTMFFLSKKFFGNFAGLLSALIYMYFPYHAVNIYVRGAVDEFFAYAFLPLLFLGILSLLETNKELFKNLKYFIFISFGLFFVSISHNLSLYMSLLLLVPVFIIMFFINNRKIMFAVVFLSSIIFGLLLASFYVIPAFMEMHYTNVMSVVGGGSDYKDHFVCLQQLWNSPWGFGGSTKGCVDGLSFKLGKVEIVFAVFGFLMLVLSLLKRKFEIQQKATIIMLIVLGISIFFTLSISGFIWQSLPYMSYLQFPWRFLNFIGLCLAFMVGYFVFGLEKMLGKKIEVILGVIMILVLLVYSYKLFSPQFYTNFESSFYTNKDRINFDISKISDEYMPIGFIKPFNLASVPKKKAVFFNGQGVVKNVYESSNHYKFIVKTQSPSLLHLNVAYFPSWKAYLNGKSIKLDKSGTGMDIRLPKTSGILELKFEQTPVEDLGNSLSLIAILGLIVGIILVRSRNFYAK